MSLMCFLLPQAFPVEMILVPGMNHVQSVDRWFLFFLTVCFINNRKIRFPIAIRLRVKTDKCQCSFPRSKISQAA